MAWKPPSTWMISPLVDAAQSDSSTQIILATGVGSSLSHPGWRCRGARRSRPAIDPNSAAWWATRPVWFAALTIVLLPLVAVFLRFETKGRAARTESTAHATGAVILIAVGFAFLTLEGFVTDRAGDLPLIGFGALALGAMLSGTLRNKDTDHAAR